MNIDKIGYIYEWKFKISTLNDNTNYNKRGTMINIGITNSTKHDWHDFSLNSGNEGMQY